ncbi:MAG: hypothetical protein ABMA64_11570 [Myxococcota bacterium]
MYLSRLELEGFRGTEHRVIDAERVTVLPSGAAGCAVADAVDLFAAALDPARLLATADRLGWRRPGTEATEGPEPELQELGSAGVAATLARGVRALTVDAGLRLDPPLFGRLREHAVRDPRVVTALGQDPVVRIKVGWLFTRDHHMAHPSVLHVRIGDVGFDTSGKDRPVWLPELLGEVGRRFWRTSPLEPVDGIAERLLAASLSPDPAVRAGFERLQSSLALAPFSLPRLGLTRGDDQLSIVFGPDLVPLRQLGRAAYDAVRWAEAAFVVRPDVLVVDEPTSPELRAWWSGLTEMDDAPVEQVWVR